jgi:hypothetical protein
VFEHYRSPLAKFLMDICILFSDMPPGSRALVASIWRTIAGVYAMHVDISVVYVVPMATAKTESAVVAHFSDCHALRVRSRARDD